MYPNISKNLNRTPRIGFRVLMVLYGFGFAGTVLMAILSLGEGGYMFISAMISLVWGALIMALLIYLYKSQVTLTKARLGKHLKKYYGLEGDALKDQIAKIDTEVGRPLYADASDKKKYNSFYITENWLVGTDGIMLMRVNACKKADITNVERKILTRYRKGVTYYYYILQVTDKNDYTYQFWLRSQENVDLAFDFLMRNKEAV